MSRVDLQSEGDEIEQVGSSDVFRRTCQMTSYKRFFFGIVSFEARNRPLTFSNSSCIFSAIYPGIKDQRNLS